MDEYIDDVPEAFHQRFRAIVPLADEFCRARLNAEYADLAREMAVAICQEGSPVLRGKPESWACGIIYSLAQVNFVTNPQSDPHATAADIASGFGISQSTMLAKARVIREGLGLMPMHPDWCVEELLHDNPLVWLHKVDGVVVDLRTLTREVQVSAFEQGLIPYIHADREPPDTSAAAGTDTGEANIIARIGPNADAAPRTSKPVVKDDKTLSLLPAAPMVTEPVVGRPKSRVRDDVVFELKVTLKSVRPPIWRRFAVPADIRLDDLHHLLQRVMGWHDCHLHEFVMKDGTRYGMSDVDWNVDSDVRDEGRFRLADLVNDKRDRFVYEYDFGDSWEHLVELVKILPPDEGVSYPLCLKGRRRCPPEDCGGAWGYMNLLAVLADPKHPEHVDLLDWAGGKIDPDEFDLDGINDLLSQVELA